ncbi:MAG TPA: hypothetical protein VEH80_11270 [Candidatus Bathyarchaeia archaeon]|nr:hypothetical protein [Candidatus Bathyarchaeia archaeon]
MSRFDPKVLGGLLLAGVLTVAVAPALAGPEDALMPIEKYTTAKAKSLASVHRARLLQFSEEIYNCMPWLSVYPGRLGFPKDLDSKGGDDRYLSTWIFIDQREDPAFAALPQDRQVSAMFSRYGVDMLRRMAALPEIVEDGNVAGLSVVLSWPKPGTFGPGKQAINETFALFVDKATLSDFLAKAIPAREFTARSRFKLFDGEQLVGRVPLEVWEDSFNSTYKVANYEPPKGVQCQ